MRVVGPIRRREARVELAMRGAQPALRDGGVRVDRPHEGDFAQIGSENAEDQKKIGVGRRGRDRQPRGERAGDLGLPAERLGEERDALAQRLEGDRR